MPELETIDLTQQEDAAAPTGEVPPGPAEASAERALAPARPAPLETLPTAKAIEEARAHAEKIKGITLAAVASSLYPQDWADFGGKPYLAGSGAERLFKWLARVGFDLSEIKMDRFERQDKHGQFYFYIASGNARFMGVELYVEGSCSARDQFFSTRYEDVVEDGKPVYEDTDRGRRRKQQRILLPAEDVDETNVRKAALTNLYGNAVTRLLGLRNLTWKQVEGLGFSRTDAASVTFKGSGTGPAAPPAAAGSRVQEPSAPPQGTWVASLTELLKSAAPVESARASILKSVTSFKRDDGTDFDGYTSVDQIKRKTNAERIAQVAYGKLLRFMEQSAKGEQQKLV